VVPVATGWGQVMVRVTKPFTRYGRKAIGANYRLIRQLHRENGSIGASCSLADAKRRYPSMVQGGSARRLASNSPSMPLCFAILLATPWQGAAWAQGRCRFSWVIAPSATRRSTPPSQTSASATSGRPADRRVGTAIEGSNIQRHRETRNPS